MAALLKTLKRYWHTLRHLRPRQIWGRAWFRLYTPRLDAGPPPGLGNRVGTICPPILCSPSMLNRCRFRFLNREGAVSQPEDWNDPDKPKLWLYHLHYFDDLNARGAEERRSWHQDLIRRWINENPPGEGVGWEPYPTSLRIVNWIKWSLRDGGSVLPDSARHSLAVQARWLERRLERHLLGNHLLVNAKALAFAGLFFEGEEAEQWYWKSRLLLDPEVEEQVLDDGGHFERSPMYHALVLKDLLDLLNLHGTYGRPVPNSWRHAASAMVRWHQLMRHPDGEIPFFNDAAFGVAPHPREVDDYAERLDVPGLDVSTRPGEIHGLLDTGYVRVAVGPVVAFLDLAPLGPDYLPAHGHADTLSFELSLGGRRLFVNSGTSTYEEGARRRWERGTAAHNTVTVDDEDSSEVWASFRVARRAQVTEREFERADEAIRVSGAHDGYSRFPGRPVHRRAWHIEEKGMEVVDRVEGEGTHTIDVRFHIHPSWEMIRCDERTVILSAVEESERCEVCFEGPGQLRLEENRWAPEFGRLEPIDTLRYQVGNTRLPLEVRTCISWRPGQRG